MIGLVRVLGVGWPGRGPQAGQPQSTRRVADLHLPVSRPHHYHQLTFHLPGASPAFSGSASEAGLRSKVTSWRASN